jgi:hypothetical protein
MIELINALLTAFIAGILGILGAYFTNWEQNIYFEYMTYLMWPTGISAVLFLFIHQETALLLGAIFIMTISWYQSTKIWFKKK